MIDCYPVKFEAIFTESCNGVFKVTAFDECCATVEIDAPMNVAVWDEIAPMIRQCLVDMKLESEDAG